MKEAIYLVIGLLLVITGILGVVTIGCVGYGRMGSGMMMGGRGMMRGMMTDMMRNMEEIDKKTEFSSNGERIFFRGIGSKGGFITNSHGMQGIGCAMCHGADAKGMQMMMIDVPSLTWSYLADPKGHNHSSGRNHPPFTEPSFKACVIAGVDPAGNELTTMMPRWQISDEDLDNLIEYLKTKIITK